MGRLRVTDCPDGIPGDSASIPRWRTEDIDEHVSKKLAGYEAAIGLLEGVATDLRKRSDQLETENRRLWRENERLKRKLFGPVVFGFHILGFHMEAADLD